MKMNQEKAEEYLKELSEIKTKLTTLETREKVIKNGLLDLLNEMGMKNVTSGSTKATVVEGKTIFKPKDMETFHGQFPDLTRISMVTPTQIKKSYRGMSTKEKATFGEVMDIKEGNSYLTITTLKPKKAKKSEDEGGLKW